MKLVLPESVIELHSSSCGSLSDFQGSGQLRLLTSFLRKSVANINHLPSFRYVVATEYITEVSNMASYWKISQLDDHIASCSSSFGENAHVFKCHGRRGSTIACSQVAALRWRCLVVFMLKRLWRLRGVTEESEHHCSCAVGLQLSMSAHSLTVTPFLHITRFLVRN